MTGIGRCLVCGSALYRDSRWIQDSRGLWCQECHAQAEQLTESGGEINFERAASLLLQYGKLDEIELLLIRTAIKLEEGNMTKASERLGIGRATIYRKVDQRE